jgi:NADH-quinone oxidoreductase subunit N
MPQPPELDFLPIGPELALLGAALVLMMVEVAAGRRVRRETFLLLTLAGISGAAALSLALWNWDGEPTVLGGMVAVDRYSVLIRLILLPVAALGALYGHHQFGRGTETPRLEFYPLLLLTTAGMTLIASAADLVVTFLALEILSLSLYVMTGLSWRLTAKEAAMKYFLLGAFSSAFFLYGIALAYGATGTTSIGGIARVLSGGTEGSSLALAAVALVGVGFGFKVAAVPFHMWTPDVYQGAPTSVVAFMSAATKVAAFAALIRVFNVAFLPLSWDWIPLVWALAAITMVVGSVLAIAQNDIKRMLAYSSIAHAGFVLTGVTAANQDGISSATFYLVAYALMIVGAFGVVLLVSGDRRTSLSSYAGLAARSPLLAALLSLFLLSLAGIPPAAGFIAKVSVFQAAVQAGHWPLVLIAVLASVVAAFFYIRVIVLMYMQEPEAELRPDRSPLPTLAVAVPAVMTLVLGVFPQLAYKFVDSASVFRW